jgi:hypothetical protein
VPEDTNVSPSHHFRATVVDAILPQEYYAGDRPDDQSNGVTTL